MKPQTALNENMPVIDIVMTHKNRLEYLKRTLKYLWERNKSEYTLSIVDDGSTDGSVKYLEDLYNKGKLKQLLLKTKSLGYYRAINDAVTLATSPFFVFMSDDVLLPDVEPDWLERMWQEFDWCNDLGILGLKNPTTWEHPVVREYEKIEIVPQYNSPVIMFRRGAFTPLKADDPNLVDEMTPISINCSNNGFIIGELKDTYCEHIGKKSALSGTDYDYRTFVKVDSKTLKPKEAK